MSLLMALLFLITGVFCIQRPRVVAAWIALLFTRGDGGKTPAWLQGRAVLVFIRLMGFLALVSATLYFYLARNAPALGP